MTWQPGDRLATDERRQPHVSWLAYNDGGQLWARPYASGRLLHHDPARDCWYVHSFEVCTVVVPVKVLERLRALLPVELPIHPDVVAIDLEGWRNRPALGAYRKPRP